MYGGCHERGGAGFLLCRIPSQKRDYANCPYRLTAVLTADISHCSSQFRLIFPDGLS